MGQTISTALITSRRDSHLSSRRSKPKFTAPIIPMEVEELAEYVLVEAPDYISDLPDECLACIFQSLSSGDRKRCSLVCRRWLRIEGQSRHRLSLNAHSDLLPLVTSLFSRFDAVTKLALKCDRRSVSIGDEALVAISLRYRNLTHLKLRACRELTDAGMAAFAKNCKALKKLSCSSCNFGAKGMNAIIDNCPSLEDLSVKRLREITTGAAAEPIGPGLAAASLKTICLKDLYNGQCFGPLIIGSKNLKTLKLSRCSGDWDKLLQVIADRVTGIVEIHLERLQVSDTGLVAISNCMNLEILHLVKTPECTDIGLVSMAERCRLLRKLYIDGWKANRIGDDGTKVGSIFEHTDLLNSLQKSLDTLDNKVILKECFIDLCSFPEDQRIPVNALVDMWMELYNLDEEAYAVAKLQELCNRNLVDLVVTRNVVSGFYNQQFAMQHDLLRELAIRQSDFEPIEQRKRLILEISANNVPAWWMEQNQPSISCRLMSISTDEKFSSSRFFIQAPEVEVLVLNVRSKNHTLPEFIKKMEKLKVFIVVNYGFFPTELSNFLLLGSVTNLKRIRLEHVSIPPFAFTSVKLEILQKITLYMCNISQAFSTSTILVSEALPNIMEISIEYSNDLKEFPVEICLLTKLKKLSIINCHNLASLPNEIGKLVNLEVLRLASCIELLELPNTIGGLCNLSILDISECLEIERLPEEIGDLQNLRQLFMMGCSSNFVLPPSIMNLEQLKEVVCDEETAIMWKPIMLVCKNLRLKVQKEDINLNWLDNHRS